MRMEGDGEWDTDDGEFFNELIADNFGLTNMRYMTSLTAFGRLQRVTKYCTKVRKAVAAGQTVEYFGHCLTQNQQIFHAHPSRSSLQPHWIGRHQLFPVSIYRS